MKHFRISPGPIALILVFALMMSVAQTSNLPETASEIILSTHKQQPGPGECADKGGTNTCQIKTYKKKITIYLHGLMVGRFQDGSEQRFELGVVKRAIGHYLVFNVFDLDGKALIKPPCVLEKELKHYKQNWVFEIQPGTSAKPIQALQMFSDGAHSPERCNNKGCKDYRHILNIEKDIHSGGMKRYKRPFKPIFHFKNGEVKAACLTDPLKTQRVERDKVELSKDIGRIAEVVKVVITLEQGQKLVLRTEDNSKVLWENENRYDQGEIEGRVLNLPDHDEDMDNYFRRNSYEKYCDYIADKANKIAHLRADKSEPDNADEPGEPEDSAATHFQNYYSLVFEKDRPDRFELINPCRYKDCQIIKPEGDESGVTVSPYLCGMMLVNSSSKKIKFKN